MPSPVFSLYRIYLRKIRQLPHLYLRQFFRVKAELDIRRALQTQHGHTFNRRLKRISQDIHKLQGALRRDTKAFAHVLDIAYGRKGSLWWELMQSLMRNVQDPRPPQIIPGVETSRPPVYSPELAALMTSIHSRTTKPLTASALKSPPTLPTRAHPGSEEARLLGPFSKRREVNIRWRYFSEECKKVRPPLEILKPEQAINDIFGFDNTEVIKDIHDIVGQYNLLPTPTRKQRAWGNAPGLNSSDVSLPKRHPSSWVRRRYRELLHRVPILRRDLNGKFVVDASSSDVAHDRGNLMRLPVIDLMSSKWYGAHSESEL